MTASRIKTLLFVAVITILTISGTQGDLNQAVLSDGIAKASWFITGDVITVQMEVESKGWIGIGWHNPNSTDEKMYKADYVIALFDSNGTLHVNDYFSNVNHNDGFTKPVLDTTIGGTDDILYFTGSQTDDRTVVTFTRKLDTGDKAADWPITDAKVNVAWARGNPIKGDTNVFNYHGRDPAYRGVVNLNFVKGEVTPSKKDGGDNLLYWHACMMVAAFGFFMSFGIFTSRYLKQYYWWFPLHIILQVVGTLLAGTALIIALIMAKGHHFSTVHSYFGISALSLAALSPILGWISHLLYNPSRDSVPIFPDQIHAWIGRLAVLVAYVAIILGLRLIEAPLPVLIVFCGVIGFYLFVYAFLEIYKWRNSELVPLGEKTFLLNKD